MKKIIAKLESFSPSESQMMGEPFSTDKAIERGKRLVSRYYYLFDSVDVFPGFDGSLMVCFYTKHLATEVFVSPEGKVHYFSIEPIKFTEENLNLFLVYASDFPGRFRCSFCGKGIPDREHLVAGENGFICEECVESAKKFIEDDRAGAVGAHLPQEDEQVRALRSRSKESQ